VGLRTLCLNMKRREELGWSHNDHGGRRLCPLLTETGSAYCVRTIRERGQRGGYGEGWGQIAEKHSKLKGKGQGDTVGKLPLLEKGRGGTTENFLL